jgi:glycine/D-amino acid oxidase-like deaminating enzyme
VIYAKHPRPETLKSIAEIKLMPFWLDDPARPQPLPALTETISTDLVVIGAGYTGLWTALLAREADAAREVVLIEAGEVASGASGRNGGFVSSSLTHGFGNAVARWPKETRQLIELGHANLNAIEATVNRYNIDCDFIRSGEINVAQEPYQIPELKEEIEQATGFGEKASWLEADQLRALVDSPTYLGGQLYSANAMVNPAKLAWGLQRACLQNGVRLFERTPALSLEENAAGVTVRTPRGEIRARKVALATNAFPPLLKQLSYYVVPVYDYVLMTEPLSAAQHADIGWHGRQGLSDAYNQFHYYQITPAGRILWGGYDAVYYHNNGFGSQFETRPETFAKLAGHFFQTFPQLEGLRFTHAWGGAIDTCSRYSAFWGTAHHGRTAYSMGFTGLGVGSSRFGAQVMLDLLDGKQTERTALEMVRTKPMPFPPEPLRSIGINLSRWSLDQADRNQGRRNLWLKAMDALGLGFDS